MFDPIRLADLSAIADRVAALLIARKQTLAVAETSAGGLIAATLLAVPGASAFFRGGVVPYSAHARAFLQITKADMEGLRSSSEPYAQLLADRARTMLRADWGLAETGAAGPSGNSYGDPAGHTCLAVSGPAPSVHTVRIPSANRANNMIEFAIAALAVLEDQLTR